MRGTPEVLIKKVRPKRFELPTFWFVAKRSIQLSYGRIFYSIFIYPLSRIERYLTFVELLLRKRFNGPAELRAHFVFNFLKTAPLKPPACLAYARQLRGFRLHLVGFADSACLSPRRRAAELRAHFS